MTEIIFDLETTGLFENFQDLQKKIKEGTYKVHVMCMIDNTLKKGFTFHDDPELPRDGTLLDGMEKLKTATRIIGHNIINFDIPVLKYLYGYEPDAQIIDTLVMSFLTNPDIQVNDWRLWDQGRGKLPGKYIGRHSLAAWGFRIGEYKDDYQGGFETLTADMIAYCQQDVRVSRKLYSHLGKTPVPSHSIQLEHDIAKICFKQVTLGMPFNAEEAEKFYQSWKIRRDEIVVALRKEFEGKFHEMKNPEYYFHEDYPDQRFKTKGEAVTHFFASLNENSTRKISKKAIGDKMIAGNPKKVHVPFNPNSSQHIHQALTDKYGWSPSVFTEKGSVSTCESVLAALEYPEAKLLTEYMVLQDRIEKVKEGRSAWLTYLRDTNCIHGGISPNATPTARGIHSKPNMGQIPAVDKPYGAECRALFGLDNPAGELYGIKNPEDWVVVGTDADALELRCLAHYLAPYDQGRYVEIVNNGNKDDGTDIHTMNQKAADLETRDMAKTLIYLIVYGGGKDTAAESLGISPEYAQTLINSFKKGIKGYWQLLKIIDNDLTRQQGWLYGLDGRPLLVRKSFAALNTLIQSAGAIICKQWAIQIHRLMVEAGLEQSIYWPSESDLVTQRLWVHDEYQFLCHKSVVDQVQKICQDAIQLVEAIYNFNCPLKAGVKVGRNWSETH